MICELLGKCDRDGAYLPVIASPKKGSDLIMIDDLTWPELTKGPCSWIVLARDAVLIRAIAVAAKADRRYRA